jgi:hypothetical protein
MPNNANRTYVTVVPYQTSYPYIDPPQQGFGLVTTMINAMFTNISFTITSSTGTYNIYGSTGGTVSSSIEISDYNNHVFQCGMTGSGTSTVSVSSSIDGYNWVNEFFTVLNAATSSITRISGRRRYFQVTLSNTSTATGSVYLLSGQ